MSYAKFEDDCPNCRPALIDVKTGKILPDDSAEMKAINSIWAATTKEQREAFHRATCLNSKEDRDLNVILEIGVRFQEAMEAQAKPVFHMCECGKHGRIILADGFHGPEFCFQQAGFRYVDAGVTWKRYSPKMAEELKSLVRDSVLPRTVNPDTMQMAWQAEKWNDRRSTNAEDLERNRVVNDKEVHDFLHQSVQVSIPNGFTAFVREMVQGKGASTN